MELGSWSNKQVAEPISHGFGRRDRVVGGGGVDFGNVGLTVWTIIRSKHGHFARIELFDPFGRLKKSVANWDSEGRVVVIVLNVSFQGD